MSASSSFNNTIHDPMMDVSNHHPLQQPQQQPQSQPQLQMPSIPLAELPLRPSTLQLLQQRGFVTTAELEDARVQQGVATLAAELDLSLGDTANLLMEIQSCLRGGDAKVETNPAIDTSVAIPPIVNGRDLLSDNNHGQNNHIVTYCQDLDELLGGGITLGQVTEIAGLPGSGKTQLAMQLAVMCRLPKLFGGVEGKALYVDAEGSFAPERCAQMAKSLSQHVHMRIKKSNQQQQQLQPPGAQPIHYAGISEREFMESIQVFRVHDEASQTATLYNLPQFLDSQDAVPVKLIIVDSIAFHYRAMTTTAKKNTNGPNNANSSNNNQKNKNQNAYGQRTKSLIRLAGFLADLARKHHLAVVCINQMTTKMQTNNNKTSENKSVLVPALGESWAHAVTTRLLLQMPNVVNDNRQRRTCQLVKSPHRPAGMVSFQITPQGIRRVPSGSSGRNPLLANRGAISQSSQEATSTQPAASTNYQTPQQQHRPMPQSRSSSMLRRPLHPRNLKAPPSYSTTPASNLKQPPSYSTTTPGNHLAPQQQQQPPPPRNPYHHNSRSTPGMRAAQQQQQARFPNHANNNNNTPHHHMVTPHSSTTTPHHASVAANMHPPNTADLEAVKRRRLL